MARENFDLIDFLFEKGISVNSIDYQGMSPLCLALSIDFVFTTLFIFLSNRG